MLNLHWNFLYLSFSSDHCILFFFIILKGTKTHRTNLKSNGFLMQLKFYFYFIFPFSLYKAHRWPRQNTKVVDRSVSPKSKMFMHIRFPLVCSEPLVLHLYNMGETQAWCVDFFFSHPQCFTIFLEDLAHSHSTIHPFTYIFTHWC